MDACTCTTLRYNCKNKSCHVNKKGLHIVYSCLCWMQVHNERVCRFLGKSAIQVVLEAPGDKQRPQTQCQCPTEAAERFCEEDAGLSCTQSCWQHTVQNKSTALTCFTMGCSRKMLSVALHSVNVLTAGGIQSATQMTLLGHQRLVIVARVAGSQLCADCGHASAHC